MLYLGFESFELILVLDLIGLLGCTCIRYVHNSSVFSVVFEGVAAQVLDLFPEPGHKMGVKATSSCFV
jgi:hypothetical protein